VREFLDADLIDQMPFRVAPIELGRGEKICGSPDDLVDRFFFGKDTSRVE